MSSNETSLLFRLRAENSQAKAAIAETRAAVSSLRGTFGSELNQIQSVSEKAFGQVQDSLTSFINSIPGGNVFISITEGLTGLNKQSDKATPSVNAFNKSIEDLSKVTGKSSSELVKFLSEFVKLPNATERGIAGYAKFGSKFDELEPKLEQAGVQLGKVAAESESAGAGLAKFAKGPAGIAVVAVAALSAGLVVLVKQLFDLSRQTAEAQGKMFDLAQQTGVAVETLSALEVVAKTTGGNIESITNSLVLFQRKLEEAQDPTSKAAESFRDLGVDVADTESSLRQALTALAAMPEGFSQTNAAAELFGARGGKQMLAILKETNGDLDAAIKRFREMGILVSDDVARAADKFNDEFAILQFQLSSLAGVAAEELIPAMIQIVRGLGGLVDAARPVASVFGNIAGPVVNTLAHALKGLGTVVLVLTGNYKGLAEAAKRAGEEQSGIIPAATISDLLPTPLPRLPTAAQSASEAATQAEAVVSIIRRSAEQANQALDSMFERGRINREKQVNEIIAANKLVLESETARIDATLTQKEIEAKALDRESEAFQKVAADISRLQQERLDKESEFELTSKALRAKAAKERADSRRNQVQNETDILVGEYDRQIKETEDAIKRGVTVESDGLTLIEQLEQLKVEARREGLERQKAIGFLTIEAQETLNDELKRVSQEADQLLDEQQRRRLERERETVERTRQILSADIDGLLSTLRIRGESIIATQQTLAAARVKTEESAAAEILKIRMELIDAEVEATKAKLESASGITDKDERVRAQADLNNQLRILAAERAAIEQQGHRDVDEARKVDLANERQYRDDLLTIRRSIVDVQLESARTVLDLMRLHDASRLVLIRTEADLSEKAESERHSRELESIAEQRRENAESNRTKEEKLEVTRELNRLEEEEAERHRLRLKEIQEQRKRDEEEAGAAGGFLSGLETGQLTQLEAGIESFADVATVAFSAVGAAVNGLAKGIGNMVQSWVLLGGQADISMKKLVATVLAGVAAQAATLAVFELALAIAALTPFGSIIYGSAAQHFKAAALFASIAAVAAVAGRAVAGDSFQSKPSEAGSEGGSAGGSTSRSAEIKPLDIDRRNAGSLQSQPIVQTIEFRVKGGVIVDEFANDYMLNGRTRLIIKSDGQG